MSIGAGVRALGMGGAYSAIANNGTAIYWNASGLGQIREPQVEIMRAFLYEGLASYDNFSYSQPLPNDVTLGVNWTRLTVDDVPIYKEEYLVGTTVDQRATNPELQLPGNPDGTFTSTDDLFQLAFAKHIHYDLNMGWVFFKIPFDLYFGSNLKYINRELENNVGTGIGYDFSLLTKTSLASLFDIKWMGDFSVGLNFQNLGGTTITWDTESKHEDEVLFNTKLGFAYFHPLPFWNSEIIISKDTDYVYNRTHHYGLEYNYKKLVSLRFGYYNVNSDESDQFSAGLSVNIYDFLIDYAFLTNNLGNTNRIGLRINF
ncbi:MAG: hypothetical protein SVM86_07440 [Candidatus Cloacimonadota bacterium]|nr:hypothetical protein [Candidatus Cloacimonadota bacterium]